MAGLIRDDRVAALRLLLHAAKNEKNRVREFINLCSDDRLTSQRANAARGGLTADSSWLDGWGPTRDCFPHWLLAGGPATSTSAGRRRCMRLEFLDGGKVEYT
jgi:hypothetical protein